eukprot:GHVP01028441.1.p1 GENE.GHVP01028441.1~~GHVP01028441.1.p1  ORF type:complete len:126 (+),score=21.86 GHVP01028441.1:32-409(+)
MSRNLPKGFLLHNGTITKKRGRPKSIKTLRRKTGKRGSKLYSIGLLGLEQVSTINSKNSIRNEEYSQSSDIHSSENPSSEIQSSDMFSSDIPSSNLFSEVLFSAQDSIYDSMSDDFLGSFPDSFY